jgi:hypothetical protein
MSLVIPKEFRSLTFPELTLVELNDTDIDRMLPHIFELVVKQGRVARSKTDAKDYDRYLRSLASRPELEGFSDDRGQSVLDGWLRASVVRMGRAGLTRATAQIDHVRPLTIASYRSGLPSRTRHRRADELIHRLMTAELSRRLGADGDPLREASVLPKLRERFVEAVGHGVTFSDPPAWTPRYDGSADIDVSSLLSLYFLDGFEEVNAFARVQEPFDSPVPAASVAIAKDLLDFLLAYGGRVPPSAFASQLSALIALRLFQLPLRTAVAVRQLIGAGELPPDMSEDAVPDPLEQYCDFTGAKGSTSDDLARACVQRDLDILRGFFPDRLLLRTLLDAMSMLGPEGEAIRNLPAPQRFAAAIARKDDPLVQAYCVMVLRAIETENRDQGADSEAVDFLKAINASARGPAERLTDVLVEGLRKRGYENQVKWFWSTGAIQKDYGLLDGTLKARRSWRYAPRDALITALLSVAFVKSDGRRTRSEMPIAELLSIFENRFGILIDRPPQALDSAETRTAAAENLESFKRRLQLLGAFDSLSDDFSAQQVRNPLKGSE